MLPVMKNLKNFDKFSRTIPTVSINDSEKLIDGVDKTKQSMLSKIKKFFEKEVKEEKSLTGKSAEIQTVKHLHKQKDNEFLNDFDFSKTSSDKLKIQKQVHQETIEMSPEPKKLSESYKKVLVNSIVISLDIPVDRVDLEFVANSRMDGKPIYRYIGTDFSKFDLPFEEVASLECGKTQNSHDFNLNNRSYADYLRGNVEKTIAYSDYLRGNLDKTIAYREYIAENIGGPLVPKSRRIFR